MYSYISIHSHIYLYIAIYTYTYPYIPIHTHSSGLQKIYLSALTMLTGHSLATRNSLRSLSRAASLNQHSSHFGEISASMIFNHLSVADIKSSSPHLNTLHIQILLKMSFFAIYNHDTLCSRQPYYK